MNSAAKYLIFEESRADISCLVHMSEVNRFLLHFFFLNSLSHHQHSKNLNVKCKESQHFITKCADTSTAGTFAVEFLNLCLYVCLEFSWVWGKLHCFWMSVARDQNNSIIASVVESIHFIASMVEILQHKISGKFIIFLYSEHLIILTLQALEFAFWSSGCNIMTFQL